MLIIGLTGSIAMGKSTASSYLAGKGLPVWSADDVVHQLYRGDAAKIIAAVFPGTVDERGVDRQKLAGYLMKYPQALGELEAIVHPLVARERTRFLQHHLEEGSPMVVLDIPLLLEKKLDDQVDVVLLMRAPARVQRQRVMQRAGMTEEKFAMIASLQLPEAEKLARADFVVDTSGDFSKTHKALDAVLEKVQEWPQQAARKIREKGSDA